MNNIFNNPDFYPTPQEVIYKMLQHYDVNGKIILEPKQKQEAKESTGKILFTMDI